MYSIINDDFVSGFLQFIESGTPARRKPPIRGPAQVHRGRSGGAAGDQRGCSGGQRASTGGTAAWGPCEVTEKQCIKNLSVIVSYMAPPVPSTPMKG